MIAINLLEDPKPDLLLCKKCSEHKQLSDFRVSKRHRYGRYPWCRPCSNKYNLARKKWRLQNPAKVTHRNPIVNGMKVCAKCKTSKPVNEFWRHYNSLYPSCKACCLERSRRWRAAHPDKYDAQNIRGRHLRKLRSPDRSEEARVSRYGLTNEAYLQMVDAQDGCCAICSWRLGKKLFVDHDHRNNKVRGLLCKRCNFALGACKDSPSTLRKAAEYLEKYTHGDLP